MVGKLLLMGSKKLLHPHRVSMRQPLAPPVENSAHYMYARLLNSIIPHKYFYVIHKFIYVEIMTRLILPLRST